MDDDQLLRYSRHILLNEIGIEGQERLLRARVLVVGAGGLGSPAALYLAASGIGHITLIDDDVVDLSNLQRQIAHTSQRVGQSKVDSAAYAMAALNPSIRITCFKERLTAQWLTDKKNHFDVVLDCSDNYATRHVVNAWCVHHGITLVSGAAVGFDGQIMVIHPHQHDCACYACLFPCDAPSVDTPCSILGVFAPLVGIVGAMQAAQAIQCLLGFGAPLANRLMMINARNMCWSEVQTVRDPHCSVCNASTKTIAPHALQE